MKAKQLIAQGVHDNTFLSRLQKFSYVVRQELSDCIVFNNFVTLNDLSSYASDGDCTQGDIAFLRRIVVLLSNQVRFGSANTAYISISKSRLEELCDIYDYRIKSEDNNVIVVVNKNGCKANFNNTKTVLVNLEIAHLILLYIAGYSMADEYRKKVFNEANIDLESDIVYITINVLQATRLLLPKCAFDNVKVSASAILNNVYLDPISAIKHEVDKDDIQPSVVESKPSINVIEDNISNSIRVQVDIETDNYNEEDKYILEIVKSEDYADTAAALSAYRRYLKKARENVINKIVEEYETKLKKFAPLESFDEEQIKAIANLVKLMNISK